MQPKFFDFIHVEIVKGKSTQGFPDAKKKKAFVPALNPLNPLEF